MDKDLYRDIEAWVSRYNEMGIGSRGPFRTTHDPKMTEELKDWAFDIFDILLFYGPPTDEEEKAAKKRFRV